MLDTTTPMSGGQRDRRPRTIPRTAGPSAAARLRSRTGKALKDIKRRAATERVGTRPLRAPELNRMTSRLPITMNPLFRNEKTITGSEADDGK